MSLRKRTRRWWRLVAILTVCLGVLPEVALRSVAGILRGRPIGRDILVARACRRLTRTILAILGISVVAAERTRETDGCLLVSNHLSYLDVLVIGSVYSTDQSGSIGFVAKSEVAAWPLIGRLARLGGALFLERGQVRSSVQTVYRVSRSLRSGRQMHVFPEGTTTDGRGLTTFHPLFFAAAIRSGRPVLPLTLRVEEVIEDGAPSGFANEIICWYGDTLFLTHFWRLLLIDSARLTLCEHAPVAVSRVDRAIGLAGRIEEQIAARLADSGDPQAPGETESGELSLDLLAGALVFSLFVNPGNKVAREMIPLMEE